MHTKGESVSDWEVMTMIRWLRSVHKAPLEHKPSTVSDLCDGFVLRSVLHAMEPDSFDEPRIVQYAVAPSVRSAAPSRARCACAAGGTRRRLGTPRYVRNHRVSASHAHLILDILT